MTDQEQSWNSDHFLDASGLRCPEPLMLLRNRMRELAAGESLHVLATDPASVRDFEQYSRFLHHPIEDRLEAAGNFHFLLRKQGRQ